MECDVLLSELPVCGQSRLDEVNLERHIPYGLECMFNGAHTRVLATIDDHVMSNVDVVNP